MFRRSQVIMSESEEQPKLDLDLGSAFLPSWAQKPAKGNPYEKYDGNDLDRPRRRDQRRQGRPPERGRQVREPEPAQREALQAAQAQHDLLASPASEVRRHE